MRYSTILVVAVLGCGADVLPPRGHVLLTIDTDAPIVGSPEGVEGPVPLFDRLRIEIYPAGSGEPCAGCAGDMDARDELFRAGLSIVVRQERPDAAPAIVRARLFRSQSAIDGRISPWSTIDVWARLPPVGLEGEVRATLFLPTERAGTPLGSLDAPTDAEIGVPVASRVATWAHAGQIPCKAAPHADERCIAGGPFWMGIPYGTGEWGDATAGERLVVLSPFLVLDHEVTVGDYRSTPGLAVPALASGERRGTNPGDWCTFTSSATSNETLPVNCLSPELAKAYCLAHGADLPTEAQLEYLMTAGGTSRYPWGNEEPGCGDLVWGLGGVGRAGGFDDTCRVPKTAGIGGPLAVSGGGGDSSAHTLVRGGLDFGDGPIFDLLGNVAEYARDDYARRADPCWVSPNGGILIDPVCQTAVGPRNEKRAVAVRGGDWASASLEVTSKSRRSALPGTSDSRVGFRCVRSSPRE